MININYPGFGSRAVSRDDALRAAYSWYQAGQIADAQRACSQVLTVLPLDPEALRLMAMIQITQGTGDAAIQLLLAAFRAPQSRSLANDVNLQLLLARAYRETGDLDQSLDVLRRTAGRSPGVADVHIQLGISSHMSGDLAGARDAYRAATRLTPESASLQSNLGAVLLQLGDAQGAAAEASKALRLDPNLAGAHKIVGCAKANLGELEIAKVALERSLDINPEPDTWYQLGVVLDELGDWDGSLAAHRSALALKADFGPALSESLFMAQRLCNWTARESNQVAYETALQKRRAGLKPFSYLSQSDEPARQQRCARLWAEQIRANAGFASGPLKRSDWRGSDTSVSAPLTVGFVSSGFHRHPTACLTAEFFEQLDSEVIRSVAFSVGPDDSSELRQRICQAVGTFHDLKGSAFAEIVQRIRQEKVDILVDLRGYGGGAVSEVMVARPAPLQVNWLAYPGTMGSNEFMDYIVLDPFIATDEVLAHTDEAALIMPASYQPTDTTREFAHLRPTRSAAGLPDAGVVFASFNNSYKFSPDVFETWMEILAQVPGSVLWLLAGKPNTSTDDNLRNEAQRLGVDPARLIMMPKLPHLEYLARLSLADLFLDTLPYNAHTTASDALWAGCPVLTCAGRSFAARVAGSLLHSAGLNDLVVNSLAQYRQMAVELGTDAGRLQQLKQRVADARDSRLFDTAQFCRDMEMGFQQMAERAAKGLLPAQIDLRKS